MRLALFALSVAIVSGCTSFKETVVTDPDTRLARNRTVVIATPADGAYGTIQYANSGTMTALAVKKAFSRFSNRVVVRTDCSRLDCFSSRDAERFEYWVIPEVLHWEDRATEWSGISDKLEIKLSIYDGSTGQDVASTLMWGKSKWFTFGGDHPQDLLDEPVNAYVSSLY